MKWETFVSWTDTTAIYPEAGAGTPQDFAYAALGLAGELGEACENAPLAQGEVSDACWYVARLYRALQANGYDMPMESVPPLAPIGVSLRTCNVVKKLLRDGVDRTKLDKLAVMCPQALAELLDAMVVDCTDLSMLDEDLDTLVAKLSSRKERGVLGGSGDTR